MATLDDFMNELPESMTVMRDLIVALGQRERDRPDAAPAGGATAADISAAIVQAAAPQHVDGQWVRSPDLDPLDPSTHKPDEPTFTLPAAPKYQPDTVAIARSEQYVAKTVNSQKMRAIPTRCRQHFSRAQ